MMRYRDEEDVMPGTPRTPGPHPAAQGLPRGAEGHRKTAQGTEQHIFGTSQIFLLPPRGEELHQLMMKLGALSRCSLFELLERVN